MISANRPVRKVERVRLKSADASTTVARVCRSVAETASDLLTASSDHRRGRHEPGHGRAGGTTRPCSGRDQGMDLAHGEGHETAHRPGALKRLAAIGFGVAITAGAVAVFPTTTSAFKPYTNNWTADKAYDDVVSDSQGSPPSPFASSFERRVRKT